jgi:hypothetical protein
MERLPNLKGRTRRDEPARFGAQRHLPSQRYLCVIIVLRYGNGKVEGVDEFLQSADKYEKLALSVPWLNKYIHDDPRLAFRISYVHNQSFGDKRCEYSRRT